MPDAAVAGAARPMIQQQVTVESYVMANTTVDLGLGKGWQIGANLFDVDLAAVHPKEGQQPLPALVMLNGQKSWLLTRDSVLSFAVGAQQGISGRNQEGMTRYAGFGYLLLGIDDWPAKGFHTTAGGYLSTRTVTGEGGPAGPLLATEYKLFEDRLHLSAEHFGGGNEMGGTTAGILVFLAKHVPLTLGYRLANQGGGGSYIFELTLLPD